MARGRRRIPGTRGQRQQDREQVQVGDAPACGLRNAAYTSPWLYLLLGSGDPAANDALTTGGRGGSRRPRRYRPPGRCPAHATARPGRYLTASAAAASRPPRRTRSPHRQPAPGPVPRRGRSSRRRSGRARVQAGHQAVGLDRQVRALQDGPQVGVGRADPLRRRRWPDRPRPRPPVAGRSDHRSAGSRSRPGPRRTRARPDAGRLLRRGDPDRALGSAQRRVAALGRTRCAGNTAAGRRKPQPTAPPAAQPS